VWITEFADSWLATDVDIAIFMATALKYLDDQPWIERYSWFAFAVRALSTRLSNVDDFH